MTKIIEDSIDTGAAAYASSWYLDEAGLSAASGSSIVPTWSGAPDVVAYASAFFGNADQMTPLGASDSNTSTSSPISTTALAVAIGDMAMYAGTVGATGTYSANNGFTEGIELTMSSSDGAAGQRPVSADGTETPSASHTAVNRTVLLGWVLQN
jgi:hypothetical protein